MLYKNMLEISSRNVKVNTTGYQAVQVIQGCSSYYVVHDDEKLVLIAFQIRIFASSLLKC